MLYLLDKQDTSLFGGQIHNNLFRVDSFYPSDNKEIF